MREKIKSNMKELTSSQKINQSILDAYSDYKKVYQGNTIEFITTPKKIIKNIDL